MKNPDVYFVGCTCHIWHIMQHIKDEVAFLELLPVLELMLRI